MPCPCYAHSFQFGDTVIRVTIVEDKKSTREGLAVLLGLSEAISCINKYAQAEEMLDRLNFDKPDIILMDIGLPGISGIEATRIVKAEKPNCEIIILTVQEDNSSIFQALCAGASGYLLKDTLPSGLIEAIIDTNNGGSPMSSSIARRVVTLFQNKLQPAKESEIRITHREQEVLSNLACGHSYLAISENLCVATDTVRFHIRNIYRKLHVHSQSAAVAKAIREELI